ncbi:MAG: sigma-70 family RNA polymerase sigma factor [Streptosporangiales bacterium]|nr:sigma-70 family RNA polymerase sigma factor [Streptosporangiales bacterium]
MSPSTAVRRPRRREGRGRWRRELLAHCYRMLGSLHDAEDLLQETLLRAWRAFDSYDERRASLPTWLYRIATNACLTALEGRAHRPLPSGLAGPSDDPEQPLHPALEVPWLQPFPTPALGGDPAETLSVRGDLRLAFVAAMQYLPARQRAVLLLHEVLEYPAAEVAEMLDTGTAAVNSALQRARVRLAEARAGDPGSAELTDPERRALVERYIAAFESADVGAITRLLTEDAALEMPPVPVWYSGRSAYARFMEHLFRMRGRDWRMIPVAANGQPAAVAYLRGEDGAYHVHTLQVFDVRDGRISRNTVFMSPPLFAAFGLAAALAP